MGSHSMKPAQVVDTWRRALSRPYRAFYKHIAFSGVAKLGNGEVPVKSGVTVMVGGNGVGKSTLMGALLRSLGPVKQEHIAQMLGPTEGMTITGTVVDMNERELTTA